MAGRGWDLYDAAALGVRGALGPLEQLREGETPYAQPVPLYERRVFQAAPVVGDETTIGEMQSAAARCEVWLSCPEQWATVRGRIRVYSMSGKGRTLLYTDLLDRWGIVPSAGWLTGRLLSVAATGGQGWSVTMEIPPGVAPSVEPGWVTLATAPTAGSAGVLALPLGTPEGHTDRAEHIRGAAMLSRRGDGRWIAVPGQPGPWGTAPTVASLSDPAEDYEEAAAPIIVAGRAIRNATAAPVDVTVQTAAGQVRVISAVQPGETVPVRVSEVLASTGWPIGVFHET